MLTDSVKIECHKLMIVENPHLGSQDSEVDHCADLVITTRAKAQTPPTPTKRTPLSRKVKMKKELARRDIKLAKMEKRGRKVKATIPLSTKAKVRKNEEEEEVSFSAIVLQLKPESYANVKFDEDEEVQSKTSTLV